MKINPECGIKAEDLVKEDDNKDKETGPLKYQTIDGSGIYSPPTESRAQSLIITW
jgi:hypothetical protein